MVTAFQDLCLGAPLYDVLLLLPLDGRNRKNSKSCGSLSKKWQVFVVKETRYP